MRNHDQKTKDMCESVLPSTSRRSARQSRRIAHGANRAAERAALRTIGRRDHEALLGDADGLRRREVRQMVWNRRSADKIGSLVRWARATVERDPRLRGAPRDEVLAYFAGLLPDDTIGRHAVQHIDFGLFRGARWQSWNDAQARRRAEEAGRRASFRADVVALMAGGFHRDLNAAIRALRAPQLAAIDRAKQDGQRWDRLPLLPLIAGAHAMDAFVVTAEGDVAARTIVERLARDLLS